MQNVLILLLFVTCAPTLVAQPLSGVWELAAGEYVNERGILVNYQTLNLKSTKILTDTHFSFTSMKGDAFWAAGTGTYALVDGRYTETLQLNSFGQKAGSTFEFDTTMETSDETILWYNARWQNGKRVEFEVWRKVQ